jgi:hypothetical protein
MANFLLLTFLLGGFIQKLYLPRGTNEVGGRMCIGDTDRDGNYELIFRPYGLGINYHYICELHLPDSWEVDSFIILGGAIIWDLGDFDSDGLYDLAMQTAVSPVQICISIVESPDSFYYPIQEVWRDTAGAPCVYPTCAYDVDRDGILEIIKTGGDPTPNGTEDFIIYESTDNNTYLKLYAPVVDSNHDVLSTIAFGDFDRDEKIEFVLGGELYFIFESASNNTYEKVWEGQIFPTNIRDCFSIADADGDDKMEFVVKGFNPPPPPTTVDAFIFEATSNNSYEVIKHFCFSNGYELYSGGYSEAGDVDGDSVPEIVLEACQDIYIIKSAGNDSFYVWETLPGNATGSNIRIFDLDNNGLNEIIVSGNNQTKIYEYVPGNIEETAQHLAPNTLRLQVYPNPASNNDVRIRYTIPNKSKVGLIIYNSLGQVVDVLVDRELEAGVYELYWNRKLSSGVYFVRLETEDHKATKKAILLR